MSKGPTPRHSKPPEPVTIELNATDVTPKTETEKSGPRTTKSGSRAHKPNVKPQTGRDGKTTSATAATGAKASETKKPEKAADAKPAVSPAEEPASSAKMSTSNPASSSARPVAPQSSSSRSGGASGMIASGVLGAAIALGGAYALQMGGFLLSSTASGDGAQIQSQTARIDDLALAVESLSEELSAQIANQDSNPESGLNGELTKRLENLEAAIAADDGGLDDPGATAELAGRIDALEGRIAGLDETLAKLDGGGARDPALAATVSELRAGQSGVNSAVSALQSRSTGLADAIEGLEQGQAGLSERLEERLSTLEARLNEPAQQVDLARAIAAAGLKTAIDRGGSFLSELEAFASVAPDDPAIPELKDLAAGGVPSRSELIEGLPAAANAAIAAADPVDPDASLVDRLMSSAMSVVKVRKVGDVEGDSTEAIAARAEARLRDGDLDAALAEWNAMPAISRKAAARYGEGLAARVRAEKLIAASLAPHSSSPASSGASQAAPEATVEAPAN